MNVTMTSHVREVLEATEDAKAAVLAALGLQLERNAKIEINKAVYDTPPSANYKRTGRLRASLTYATSGSRGKPGAEAEPGDYAVKGTPRKDTVYVGTNVEYAASVEMGANGRKGRPYLRPALTNHIDEYEQIAAKGLSEKMSGFNG